MYKKLAFLAVLLLAIVVSGAATAERTDATADKTAHTMFAAGDIASCASNDDHETAELIGMNQGQVVTLGDNVYPDGTAWQFANCFDPTWGPVKSRIRPVPGNHEYRQGGAAPYFEYFGSAAGVAGKGYYSFDMGGWHIIALNSNCAAVGGCGTGSPQWKWLYSDLKKNTKTCTAAYWHHPLFSAGNYSDAAAVRPFWQLLYTYGAEIVMNGHDHNYQRFAPQDPWGTSRPERGIRQFVVGTGGVSRYPITRSLRSLEASDGSSFGVLRLDLTPTGYTSKFVPAEGSRFTDSAAGTCIDPPVPPPSIDIAASPGVVTHGWWSGTSGSWTKLSGILKNSKGARLSGATVYIQRHNADGWKTIATVTSDSSGHYSKWLQPRATGEYRALAKPFSALGVDRWTGSGRVRVSVRYRVGAGLLRAAPHALLE